MTAFLDSFLYIGALFLAAGMAMHVVGLVGQRRHRLMQRLMDNVEGEHTEL